MTTHKNLMTLCVAALFTLGLAACGSDGGDDTAMPVDPTPPPTPEPDPADEERQAIGNAIAAAMAAVNAVNDASTDEMVEDAETAVAAAMTAIDDAAHISAADVNTYRASLATISGNLATALDSRTMAMDLANQRQAITDATGLPADEAATHRASLATISGNLSTAMASRTTAMDLAGQRMAVTDAIAAAMTAVAAVNDASDDATVTAAQQAVADAMTAIDAATGIPASEAATHRASLSTISANLSTAMASRTTAMTIASQRMAITDAIAAAMTAVAAVNDASDDATVTAAQDAVADAMTAIGGATHLLAGELATHRASLATISGDLTTAMDSRTTAMNLANQRMAISDAIAAAMTAVGEVNDASDDATVKAAEDAITAANAAIDDAGDIPASEAATARDRVSAIYKTLSDAKTKRQAAIDEADRLRQEQMQADARRTEQLTAITTAIDAARTAVAAVNDESTQQEVDDARAAVTNAKAKIDEAADVSDDVKATHTASVQTIETSLNNAVTSWETAQADNQDLANQRMAISNAIDAARTAVNAVDDDSTDEQVDAAEKAIADARVVIAEQTAVPAEEKAANNGTLGEIMTQLDNAKTSRTAAIAQREKEAEADRAEMQATATKLYAGIGADPLATGTEDGARDAVYGGTDSADIVLTIDEANEGFTAETTANLTEDEDTTVADNHGWKGKRYTRTTPASQGTYEAIVYSNVEDPTMGAKFNSGTGDDNVGFATTDGVLTLTADTNVATRIASPSFDHTAGSKTFHLPEDNPQGESMIVIPGSYYGVAGRYSCNPGTDADGCAVTRAENGYTLDVTTDAWTFKATNPEARVMDAEDTVYASYGWWLHKSANGQTFTASAFAADKGAVDDAALTIAGLNGTATYRGGAAGKYALSSSTGGTNDAGHFTARAMLEANFNDETISGTIDNFMGADDQPRNWSVELMESVFSTAGAFPSLRSHCHR